MANLDTNVRASSGLMKDSVASVVWELRPVKIEKRVIFLYFIHFAYNWSNLWDIIAI